jgi:hypothetical protein
MRLLGLSEDRKHLLLTGPETGPVLLPVDDRVKAAVLGDSERLASMPPNLESALSPREMQARFRAGESAEQVALAAGVPVDWVRRFEGPVRDERVHAVDRARAAFERGSDPAPLGDRIDEQLVREGADPSSVEWDSWRREDGTWTIQLRYLVNGQGQTARWQWDSNRRVLTPADDSAGALGSATTDRHYAEAIAVTADEPPVNLTLVREPPIVDPQEERRTGKTDRQAEADGVAPGKRATVPSWDEILLGTRPPEH